MSKKLLLSTLFVFLIVSLVKAGSPPNLVTNISLVSCNCTAFPTDPDAYFNANTQIAAAFNYARRAEEAYFGLSNGALGSMILPSNYNNLTDSEKGLFLINSERVARGGIDYDGAGPNSPVLGLTLNGLDANLNNLSQTHVAFLQATNTFTHTGPGGNSFARIATQFGTQKEFMARAENLYLSCGGYNTHILEQAIFSWLYQDSGSAWGHRAAILIQDTDPTTGQNGYDDNYGPTGVEGFLGFGILKNISFPAPCGALRLSAESQTQQPNLAGNLVVMMVLDPSPTFMQPLPLTLLSFNVEKSKNEIELNWTTSNEKNNQGFEIERSENGQKFVKIGLVGANNTSFEQNKYQFIDTEPIIGLNYYRLKQIDLDGSFDFSPIKIIKFEQNIEISLFPNPTQNSIILEGLPKGAFLEIFNSFGNSIYSNRNYIQNSIIDLNGFSNGYYIMKIVSNKKTVFRKFIVNK